MEGLTPGVELDAATPFVVFARWFEAARAAEPEDPNAMTLATVDADGLPNARVVLMKGYDAEGFVFYTNTLSAKGRELDGAGRAAIVFHWKSLRRQVRARGIITRVSDAEADAYFASRPRDSQLGAWASRQSQPLDRRETFEAAIAARAAEFGENPVPRPPHWTGYRLTPTELEFWRDRPFRLHDRVRLTRPAPAGAWTAERLYP